MAASQRFADTSAAIEAAITHGIADGHPGRWAPRTCGAKVARWSRPRGPAVSLASRFVRDRAVAAMIDVDVRDGTVTLDCRPLAVEPVAEVPLSRRYFLR